MKLSAISARGDKIAQAHRLRALLRPALRHAGKHLGHPEQAHGKRHEADAVYKVERTEGEPELAGIDIDADQPEPDAQAHHGQSLDGRADRHGRGCDEPKEHDRKIFRRAEGERKARRYGLNTVTIIHNNATWGVIEAGQKRAGFTFGTALQDTDYAAIARGFGCHGATVSTPEALGPALEAAAASGLPAVIDCRVAFVPHPSMSYFGAIGTGHADPT